MRKFWRTALTYWWVLGFVYPMLLVAGVHENYEFQNEWDCPGDTTTGTPDSTLYYMRAQDHKSVGVSDGDYFRGLWTFVNSGDTTCVARFYTLDGSGAALDSVTKIIRGGYTYNECWFADSCRLRCDGDEAVEVDVHGGRADMVSRLGDPMFTR
jgi:hypothetical protein